MTLSNSLDYYNTEFFTTAKLFDSDPRAFTKLYSRHGLIDLPANGLVALSANVRLGWEVNDSIKHSSLQ
jgi:hypothetical protein